jgi:hypothetical protein
MSLLGLAVVAYVESLALRTAHDTTELPIFASISNGPRQDAPPVLTCFSLVGVLSG